jgi:hypothetical protein
VIKITNRRVNAIEHVIIPKIERTLAYIISELVSFQSLFSHLKISRLNGLKDEVKVLDSGLHFAHLSQAKIYSSSLP